MDKFKIEVLTWNMSILILVLEFIVTIRSTLSHSTVFWIGIHTVQDKSNDEYVIFVFISGMYFSREKVCLVHQGQICNLIGL